jgi:hypothetical protein
MLSRTLNFTLIPKIESGFGNSGKPNAVVANRQVLLKSLPLATLAVSRLAYRQRWMACHFGMRFGRDRAK